LISCFIDYPPVRVFWIAHFIKVLTSIHARLPKGHILSSYILACDIK